MRPFLALLVLAGPAFAQHVHPTETITDAAVARYYETWRMPDDPYKSCCSKADCYATEVRIKDGRWQARRREDGKWLTIPPNKIERHRDSPDGRNHLCAPPPGVPHHSPDSVFCFQLGSGT